jgi:hypothetical protein
VRVIDLLVIKRFPPGFERRRETGEGLAHTDEEMNNGGSERIILISI